MKSFPRIACVLIVLLSAISLRGQSPDVINHEDLPPVVHVEKMTRSAQKGDTLVYNAAAYQVMQGADSENLLAKMPGVSVTESGVEAGGKEVKRILLDGQEFFGNDVLAALRTIPADMVRQIEVINKLSDNAQLTGVDDGEGYTAINVVTRKRKGDAALTGRIYGSYGLPEKPGTEGYLRNNYITGGNLSRFSDKNTVNLIGMTNNISKFNFTTSDILSGASGLNEGSSKDFNVKSLPGISQVHSLGANYSDKKMNFSYLFNVIDNENYQETQKNTMTSVEDRIQSVTGHADSRAANLSHRFNGKITFSPAKRHSVIIRPELVLEDISNSRNGYSLYRYTYADDPAVFLYNQLNVTGQERLSIRATATANYRYSFRKKRRSLSAYSRYSYYQNVSLQGSEQYRFRSEDTDFDIGGTDVYSPYLQDKDYRTRRHDYTAKFTYTEPLSRRTSLSVEYTAMMQKTSGDNLVSVRNNSTGEFQLSDRLSAVNVSTFVQDRLGSRFSWWRKKMNIVLNATYQHTGYTGEVTLPSMSQTARSYHHILYQLTANLPFDKSNTLRIEARGRTRNPSNSLLQDVVNMSSTSNIRAGNPDLDPSYMHEAEVRYTRTDSRSGSTFNVTATYAGSASYVCDSLVINTPDFEVMDGVKLGENNQYVKPVNLSGYHNLYMKISYGVPVNLIRCNVNVNAAMHLRQIPSMINSDYVPIHNNWYQIDGRVHSNISRNLDFMVGYNARYSANEYRGRFGLVENNFLLHIVKGKLKWVFLGGYTLTASSQYRQYVSTAGLFNDRMMLCDIFLGRKFLKDKTLEVSVGVNDLFDDNTRSYWHSVNASGTNDGFNIGLGRYFSIQCIWHIRAGAD